MNREDFFKAQSKAMDPRKAEGMDKQLALNIAGKSDEAYALSEKLYVEYPEDDRIAFNHGWHLVRRGYLADGFRMLSRGRNASVFGSPYPPTGAPMFDIKVHDAKALEGKTIIWFNEGGLGDEMLFLRFAYKAYLLGAKIIVGCHVSLACLFTRIPWVSATFDVSRAAGCGIFHSYWIPAMSSPALLDVSEDELCALSPHCAYTADPTYTKKWQGLFEGKTGKRKIGVRWAGNPEFEHQQHRTYPINDLVARLSKDDLIVSFQIDHARFELKDAPNIFDPTTYMQTWDDTVAALKQIDVLITSCTSLAHLAGSMGVRTMVIVPCLPYYPWAGTGTKSAWYGDNVTVCRQTVYGDWEVPISEAIQNIDRSTV